MPTKCKCPQKCKVHNQCSCGKLKKIVSETCRICYIPKYPCEDCGVSRAKTKSKLCSECYKNKRIQKILNNETPIKDMFYSDGKNKYNKIRFYAKSVISTTGLKKECRCCNFTTGIQVCHIKPIAEFDKETPLNVVNANDNLILLCPNCHWLFDHGYPSVEKVKSYYRINKI